MCTLTLISLLLAASDLPRQEAPDVLALLRTTAGEWTGTLAYRDFGSGRSVSIPARLKSEVAAGGQAVVWKLAMTDPGRVTESLDVATVESGGVLAIRSFGAQGVEAARHRLTERRIRSLDEWSVAATGSAVDGGRATKQRRTWSLAAGTLSQKTEVLGTDGKWFVRNELALARPEAMKPDASTLVGRWKVDLRPTPNSEPYYKTMVIGSVTEGDVEGVFYDTPLANGRVNTDWGAVRFAFTTGDGSGAYHTQGVLRGDRIEGTTHAAGRGFLSCWTATRIK